MAWQQLSLTIPSTAVEAVEEQLLELGALSITLQDAQDEPILEPMLGTMPLWSLTVITALFTLEDDVLKIVNLLTQQQLIPKIEIIPDQNWEREWLKYFKPLHFGNNVWIIPTGYEIPDLQATNILLDPGLAFGTGTHPTTAMCLNTLGRLDLKDKTVVDYGCGSGILAIAAAKLGAREIWAIDYDPQAVIATLDNAERNQIPLDHFNVGQNKNLPNDFRADILVANILTNALIELAPLFAQHVKPEGQLVLSGILAEQAEIVLTAYAPFFKMNPPLKKEDWICLSGERRI